MTSLAVFASCNTSDTAVEAKQNRRCNRRCNRIEDAFTKSTQNDDIPALSLQTYLPYDTAQDVDILCFPKSSLLPESKRLRLTAAG